MNEYTTYEAVDGERFTTQQEAVQHELDYADGRVQAAIADFVAEKGFTHFEEDLISPLAPFLSHKLSQHKIQWGEDIPQADGPGPLEDLIPMEEVSTRLGHTFAALAVAMASTRTEITEQGKLLLSEELLRLATSKSVSALTSPARKGGSD